MTRREHATAGRNPPPKPATGAKPKKPAKPAVAGRNPPPKQGSTKTSG
jgi:hypothetical protein